MLDNRASHKSRLNVVHSAGADDENVFRLVGALGAGAGAAVQRRAAAAVDFAALCRLVCALHGIYLI